MGKSVERYRDPSGRWWVREDGVRKASFRTRSEARLYASGGMEQPSQAHIHSPSRDALIDLYTSQGKKKILELMRHLDPLDMRVVSLHLQGASQKEVADLVGVSQPSVSYRLSCVVERLKFLIDFPEINHETMREVLSKHLKDPLDVSILIGFVQTTSQSIAAHRLGISQGMARHRIQRALKILSAIKSPDSDLVIPYIKAIQMAQNNLNILNAHLTH